METQTATITIRLIRSFEFRNIRNVVLKDIPLSLTCEELKTKIMEVLPTAPGLPPPFRKYSYDTLKIEHQAHGAKTNDPVINREDDEKLFLKPEASLISCGVKNETEISFFNLNDYEAYKMNPLSKWECTT